MVRQSGTEQFSSYIQTEKFIKQVMCVQVTYFPLIKGLVNAVQY